MSLASQVTALATRIGQEVKAAKSRANHTGSPTAAWSNGSQKITDVAAGTTSTDAINKGQLDAIRGRISVTVPTIDGNATGPGTAELITKYGTFNSTAGASGITNVTFATAFPNGIINFQAFTISGSGVNPVVNAGLINKTTVQLIHPGVASGTALKYTWSAVGW